MKSKSILFFYIIAMIGLWSYKKYTHVYLAQCSDNQFHTEILERLQYITRRQIEQKNLPLYKVNQSMQQYNDLKIQVAHIRTQRASTRQNPVAQCLATLKISPQTPIQKNIPITQLIQQHSTVWQPETQSTMLVFTANINRDSLSEAVKTDWKQLEIIAQLPTEWVLAWNEHPHQMPPTPRKSTTLFIPNQAPKPISPPSRPATTSFTATEFKQLSKRDQKAVLSKEIADLILGLTPAERQAWFKHRSENKASLWSCQFDQNCTVEQLQEQKRVLQKIKKNH